MRRCLSLHVTRLQAFLFNDIILFGQESGEKQQYTYVRQLKLQSVEDLADTSTHPNMFKVRAQCTPSTHFDCRVVPPPAATICRPVGLTPRVLLRVPCSQIHGTVGQVRKTYLLSAGTNVDKSRWVEALYKCAGESTVPGPTQIPTRHDECC